MSSNINEDAIHELRIRLSLGRSLSACQVHGALCCQCTDAMSHLCMPSDGSVDLRRMDFLKSASVYVETRRPW